MHDLFYLEQDIRGLVGPYFFSAVVAASSQAAAVADLQEYFIEWAEEYETGETEQEDPWFEPRRLQITRIGTFDGVRPDNIHGQTGVDVLSNSVVMCMRCGQDHND